MNEITKKLYENAGIKAKWKDKRVKNTKTYYTEEQAKYLRQTTKNRNIQLLYPPFTKEKQIELIKWLCQHTYRNYIKFRFDICGLWYCECNMSNSDMHHTFEDALIDVLMQIWQDLSPEEKQQVKGILE